jgi:hypothetical protein
MPFTCASEERSDRRRALLETVRERGDYGGEG